MNTKQRRSPRKRFAELQLRKLTVYLPRHVSLSFPEFSRHRKHERRQNADARIRSEIFLVVLFYGLTVFAVYSEHHESRSSAGIYHRSAVPYPDTIIQTQNGMMMRDIKDILAFQSDRHRIQACNFCNLNFSDAYRNRKHAARHVIGVN